MAKDMPDFSQLPVTIHRQYQTIDIHRDRVSGTEGDVHKKCWEEPLSAFKGILRGTGKDNSIRIQAATLPVRYTFHLVELVHPDKECAVEDLEGSD